MKKIVSLIIAIQIALCTVIIPMNAVAATDMDAYYLETLVALDVISEDIDYESTVTRGEFTELILKLVNKRYKNSNDGQIYFKDVSTKHEYYSSITNAAELGLIEGFEQRYYPDREITVEEVATVLSKAMGYGPMLERKSAISIADGLDILDGVSEASNGKITNAGIVRMFFNALLANIAVIEYSGQLSLTLDSEVTLIESIYKGREVKGIVTKNQYTGLTDESGVVEGYVEINDEEYEVGETEVASYLGYEIRGIVIEESDVEKFISFTTTQKNNVIIVKAEDIYADTTTTSLKYDDGKRTETVSIRGYDLIYNGRSCGGYTDADLKPSSGEVILLDNNNDGDYEVVFVNTYKTVFVSGIDTNAEKIYDQYGVGSIICDENTIVENDRGYGVDYTLLKKNDVISVYQSKGADPFTRIVISSKETISGRISSHHTEDGISVCIIDGNEYTASKEYADFSLSNANKAPALNIGLSGTFYLDHSGKIAGFVRDNSAEIYGFLMKFRYVSDDVNESGEEGIYYKVYTQNDEFISGEIKKRIKVNDVRTELSDISANSYLYDIGTGELKPQLIKFTRDSDGVINSIKYADYNNPVTNPMRNDLTKLEYNEKIDQVTFRSGANKYANKYLFDANTTVFVVPGDDNPDYSNEKEYMIDDWTGYVDGQLHTMQIFDTSIAGVARAAVKSEATGTANYASEYLMSFVKNTYLGLDDNEEPVTVLELVRNGETKEYFPANEAVDDVFETFKEGDIIQILVGINGKVKAAKRIFTFDNAPETYLDSDWVLYANTYARRVPSNTNPSVALDYATLLTIYGVTVAKGDKTIAVTYDNGSSMKAFTCEKNAKVYNIWDDGQITQVDFGAILESSNYDSLTGTPVLLNIRNELVREIFIINRD